MQKNIGRILTALIAIGAISGTAYGITNPLKTYDLYADSHRNENSERENVMSEYYSNSLSASYKKNTPPAINPANSNSGNSSVTSLPELPSLNYDNSKNSDGSVRRNSYLRESAKHVYSDSSKPAAWTEGPTFYSNPSLSSIKAKYKKSDFAGCMQECEAYVKKYPKDELGFYYLAMCYTKVNDRENAIKAYEKVISLNSNPMIVKYATNGRNCAMKGSDTCYENVNVPEYLYPYANITDQELTPVDPNTLIQRNLDGLYNKISPISEGTSETKDGAAGVSLPFGTQDAELDKFINSPYGNGLSPKLNREYKEQQLKKIQETINDTSNTPEQNIQNIKEFDNSKSELENSLKLAYDTTAQKELDELDMLWSKSNSSTSSSDDLVKYLTEQGENLSPEVIQALMVKSMMPDFTFINTDSKNLL